MVDISEVAKILARHLPPGEDLFLAPDIPPKTLGRVRRTHGEHLDPASTLLAVYEDRFLFDRSGFAFTEHGFLWQNFAGADPVSECVLPYSEIDPALLGPTAEHLRIGVRVIEVSDAHKVPGLYWRVAAALAELGGAGDGPTPRVPDMDELPLGALLALAREHLDRAGAYMSFGERISSERITRAHQVLKPHLGDKEEILALHDTSVVGAPDPGFVVTPAALVWAGSLGAPAGRLPWRYLEPDGIHRESVDVACMGVSVPVLGEAAIGGLADFLAALAEVVRGPAPTAPDRVPTLITRRPGRAKPALGDRALFPDLAPRWYLNHAAVSPPSAPVRAAAQAAAGAAAIAGLGALETWLGIVGRAKTAVAALIGGEADHVALVGNTTQGVQAVAMCMPWKRGDRVVVFDGEFPTNVTPWQRAAELFELEIVTLPAAAFDGDDRDGLVQLANVLHDGAALVAASAVQFQTGLRMPWAKMGALCAEHGAALCLDGIQAVGVVPMDVATENVDFVVAGSHKWLMGYPGSGFVYARPERWAAMEPRLAGWLSHEEPIDFLGGPGLLRYDKPLRRGPAMLEGGMPSVVPAAALAASIEMLVGLGVPAIFEHVQAWHDALEPRAVAMGFESLRSERREGRSGILSLRPPEGVVTADLVAALGARGASVTGPEGLLRLSPHWPNGLDEVDALVPALADALLELRG